MSRRRVRGGILIFVGLIAATVLYVGFYRAIKTVQEFDEESGEPLFVG